MIRSAAIVGAGMIGTSIALALREHGITVHLSDRDPAAVRTATSLGAGLPGDPPTPADIAVIAVPPAHTAKVLADAQARHLAAAYTDTASVKSLPLREIDHAGCDTTRFVGGHPIAGRERSGPLAARADLFQARSWALTPTAATSPATLDAARDLVTACGATPVLMDAADHDHALAVVSHVPQVIASLMAARLLDTDPTVPTLAGQGLRDVVRIAGSDPALWTDILTANPAAVADVLDHLGADLAATVTALRGLADGRGGTDHITDLLRRGNDGTARIPGKHGGAPQTFATVSVTITDRPGELARLFADAGSLGANIEDVHIEHSTTRPEGVVEIQVTADAAAALTDALAARGWTVQR